MEKYKKEELERYIFEENMPYDKIGEKYGVTGSSIRKQAKRMGINLPKRRKINPSESFNKGEHLKEVKKCFQCGREITYKYGDRKYCSLECWAEATREKKVKE